MQGAERLTRAGTGQHLISRYVPLGTHRLVLCPGTVIADPAYHPTLTPRTRRADTTGVTPSYRGWRVEVRGRRRRQWIVLHIGMCRTIHYLDLVAQAARSGICPWYFNLCKRLAWSPCDVRRVTCTV
jgi:hypothetical protein